MPELELTRSREDRKLYVLDGVGTLRLRGWTSRGATAEADGRSWEIDRRGIFTSIFEAADARVFQINPKVSKYLDCGFGKACS
jgi:hypothetical protein